MLPIQFRFQDAASGANIAGGMQPLKPMTTPFVFGTPFGVTDADVKGPPIPKPIIFAIRSIQSLLRARMRPLPAPRLLISGITKDSTGTALASCTVALYRTADSYLFETVVSDAVGAYAFSAIGLGETYYVVAYKAGSPDVAGTTVNTLVGV